MRRIIFAVLWILACIGMQAQSWPDAEPESRPGTRWWWMGSAVDSLNINRLIDEYSHAGIGSVEITPIYGVKDNEDREISYLSPQWMRMLAAVNEAAGRNGMLVDMNQGTGWPFGGPEVTIDDAACKAIFRIDTVAAGHAPKVYDSYDSGPIAESRRKVADGKEEVIRVYLGKTGQRVKRAAPGGEGYVVDHFDRGAIARYLSKFDKAFSSSGAAYPHNFFNDSYEVFGANWTPSLLDEFRLRRGYNLEERLPELLGLVDDGNQTLCDYRETLGELLLENFTRQWADWAHARGSKVRNQAHGSPANLIDLYAAVDVPETEGFGLSDFGVKGLRTDKGFTRRNDSDVSMLKYASSAAHITGKPLTSSETFTWLTEHFRTSLSQMKPDLDLMLACGVNHLFFHGTCYSPVDEAWPGWKFYASVDMSPTNTIWRDAPAMMEYITRCQSMLREGGPDNDFLVYLPVRDMWFRRLAPRDKGLMMNFSIHSMRRIAPDFIESVMRIDSLGFDCDYISDRYLLGTKYNDGCLETAAGTRYKALVVPGSGRLTPRLKAHLDSLQSQGADIIYGIDSGRMLAAATPEAMRTKGLRTIRRRDNDGYIYFISNLSDRDINDSIALAVDFADAVWFDPMNGDIYGAGHDRNKIHVNLRSGESRILHTYDNGNRGIATRPTYTVDREYDLSALPWTLEIDGKKIGLDSLTPWTALGDSTLNEFAGTGAYTATVSIDPGAGDHWQIDLGDVRESARVYVNGEYVGTAWAAPFTLDFDGMLHEGENEIRIEVTNLPANRIAAMDRKGIEWRKFKEINMVDIHYKKTGYGDWEVMPSGLNSTVSLRRYRQ